MLSPAWALGSEIEGIYLPEINGIPLDFKVSATFPVEDLEKRGNSQIPYPPPREGGR